MFVSQEKAGMATGKVRCIVPKPSCFPGILVRACGSDEILVHCASTQVMIGKAKDTK